jgi:hypothetical protein
MQYGVFHIAALILLISFSHLLPLDSMFKGLLYICVSLLTLDAYTQVNSQDWPSPSEMAIEDPARTVTELSALISEHAKILLTWKANAQLPDFFAIERSDNGKSYEVVTVLNNLTMLPVFQWTDDSPKKGRSFYRLRYSFKEGPALYSKTVSAQIAGIIDFKFYPNPVDHILIVRSESPLEVNIIDGNAKIRLSVNRVQGLQTINVSSLEKGIYLIRFINKLTNVISQEKLVKN